MGEHKEAVQTLLQLKDIIHGKYKKHDDERLIHKNQLFNTSLFLFKHAENPGAFMFELFSSHESSLSAMSPHLYRYYIVACILSQSKGIDAITNMRSNADISLSHNASTIEIFAQTLLDDFNFEGAFKMIDSIKEVCAGDFFLKDQADTIAEHAQKLVVLVYAKIHNCIEMEWLSSNLGKSAEQAIELASSALDYHKVAHKMSEDKSEIMIAV